MMGKTGRPSAQSGMILKPKNKRWCIYGGCKTSDRTNTDPNVFFISFPQPCATFINNRIAQLLGHPTVEYSPSDCQRCSKCLRWMDLCNRPDSKYRSLENIHRSVYLCSKHFVDPHPKFGPNKDYPDPFIGDLSQQSLEGLKKVFHLKNSKRKKPEDVGSAAVATNKKNKGIENVSEDAPQNRADNYVNQNSGRQGNQQERLNDNLKVVIPNLQTQTSIGDGSSNQRQLGNSVQLVLVPYLFKETSSDRPSSQKLVLVNGTTVQTGETLNTQFCSKEVQTTDNTDEFEAFVLKYMKLGWFANINGQTATFMKSTEDSRPLLNVKVTNNIDNFSYSVYVVNQLLKEGTVLKLEEMAAYLSTIYDANICQGIADKDLKDFYLKREVDYLTSAFVCAVTNCVRSKRCFLVTPNPVCQTCSKYSNQLRHRLKIVQTKVEAPNKFANNKQMSEKELRSKLQSSAKTISEANKKISRQKKAIEKLKKEKPSRSGNQNSGSDLDNLIAELYK